MMAFAIGPFCFMSLTSIICILCGPSCCGSKGVVPFFFSRDLRIC